MNIVFREWRYVNVESNPCRKIVLHLLKSWKHSFQRRFFLAFPSYGIPNCNLRTTIKDSSIQKLRSGYCYIRSFVLRFIIKIKQHLPNFKLCLCETAAWVANINSSTTAEQAFSFHILLTCWRFASNGKSLYFLQRITKWITYRH